MNAMLKE
jgi:ribonuclease Z